MSAGHLITIRREIRGCPKTGPNVRFCRPKCTLMSGRTRHRSSSGHAHRRYTYGVLSGCPVLMGVLTRLGRGAEYPAGYSAGMAAQLGGNRYPARPCATRRIASPIAPPNVRITPCGCVCLNWHCRLIGYAIDNITFSGIVAYNVYYGKSCAMQHS